jgi:aminoglycoside phosphotransferase (APT) family kinase protein
MHHVYTDQCQPLEDDELREFLARVLRGEDIGSDVRVLERRIVKRRADWRGVRLFEEITVSGGKGITRLFVKYCQPRAESEQTAWQSSAEREARVYQDVLPGRELGTARCFGVLKSPDAGRTVLFLEFVEGRRLKRIADERIWMLTARWLGRMHASFLSEREALDYLARLRRHDAPFYRDWARRAMESAAKVSRQAGEQFTGILSSYGRVAEPLGNAEHTLIHGEFYCTNILVQPGGEGVRICPFDWETAASGCGALDLTYLLRQKMGISESCLVQAYMEGWREGGGRQPGPGELHAQICRCRIHELMYAIWSSVNHRHSSPEKILRYTERVRMLLQSL